MIEVELPDGRIVEIDTNDPEQAANAARRFMQSQVRQEQPAAVSGPDMQQVRQQAVQDVASEVGPLEAFMIGTGKGFMDIGRGLGIVDDETEGDRQAMEALREQRPYTTGAGEITGQAAPFVPAGLAAGAIPSLAGRIAAGAGLGAAEGGIIASGTGQDVVSGAGVGAAIGGGAEILFPVLGRLGRSVYRRVKGVAPEGAMLDAAGRPTRQLQEALDEAGMSFNELTADAQRVVAEAAPGSDPTQVSRAARFAQEDIPMTRGQLTQRFEDIATEERLMASTMDPNAAPFREFRQKQSEAIRRALSRSVDLEQTGEETGNLIKDALAGRKSLLRSQKNDLYQQAAEAAKDSGGIPLFTDNLKAAVPDADTFEDLAITAEGPMRSLDKLLTRYGIKEPTQEMIDQGFQPKTLDVRNFESFRKSLNAIARGDNTGAVNVAIGPIREALDDEIMNLADTAADAGLGEKIIEPLRKARAVVREMKTEFNPRALAGQLVDVRRNSEEPVIYGSKVYDKLVSKATPVEGVRATVANLRRAGPQGAQALGDLQATTMLDLIEAGFGTKSRKIEGIPVFNPNAFQRRLERIGEDKLASIFSDNPSMLGRLKNISKIATDLIPPADTVPRGSAPVLMDIMQRLGAASITAKVPGAGLLFDKIADIARNYQTRQQVSRALRADPDIAKVVYRLDREFPGIASALGIAGISTMEEDDNEPNPNQ